MFEFSQRKPRCVRSFSRPRSRWYQTAGAMIVGACLTSLFTPACRTADPPDPPPVSWSERDDNATLMRFVHRDEPAWIRADLSGLRAHAVLGTLFEVVEGQNDPLSESIRTGDELLVVWHDLSMARRSAVVRGQLDRVAVENAVREGALTNGGPMQLLMVGDVKLWKDPMTQQALALPAANLLISGSALDVELQIARQRMPSSATTEWDSVVEGHYRLSMIHKRLLAGSLPREIMALLEPASGFRLKVTAGPIVEVTLRMDLEPGTDGQALVQPLAQLIQQVLEGVIPDLAPVLAELIQIGAGTSDQGPYVRLVLALPDPIVAELIGATREQMAPERSAEPGAAAPDMIPPTAGSGAPTAVAPPP